MASPDFEVKGSDLRKLSKDLRKHADGKRLLKELRQELRKVAKPFVPAIRSAIGAIPSKGQSARLGRPSLRRQLQKATRLQAKTGGKDAGVVIEVVGDKLNRGKNSQTLPAYMEGTMGRPWRTRNWGRDQWKEQSAHPFFYKTVRPAESDAVQAAQGVVERIAREVENG